jgi:hypothetical protein
MSDGESIYDTVIAPALLAVAKSCREHGLQFVAVVEYETGAIGRTEQSNLNEAGPQFRLAAYGARCNGNADALVAALLKDDQKHAAGQSQSIYLHRLAKDTQ